MEFRKMRRGRQQLSDAECAALLERGSSGVLAVLGDNGYPYAVPLSYLYRDGHIYFHCARAGHKLDAVRRCDRASFCVIDRDEVIPEAFTTHYRSAIAFGRVRELEGAEKRAAVAMLADKYAPGLTEARDREIEAEFARLCVLDLQIEHMTGKRYLLPQGGVQ